MAAPETPQLTEAETDFAQHLATLMEGLVSIQEEARKVVASGGDCKRAFLAIVPEEDRPGVEMQWPYIGMMLGV